MNMICSESGCKTVSFEPYAQNCFCKKKYMKRINGNTSTHVWYIFILQFIKILYALEWIFSVQFVNWHFFPRIFNDVDSFISKMRVIQLHAIANVDYFHTSL